MSNVLCFINIEHSTFDTFIRILCRRPAKRNPACAENGFTEGVRPWEPSATTSVPPSDPPPATTPKPKRSSSSTRPSRDSASTSTRRPATTPSHCSRSSRSSTSRSATAACRSTPTVHPLRWPPSARELPPSLQRPHRRSSSARSSSHCTATTPRKPTPR